METVKKGFLEEVIAELDLKKISRISQSKEKRDYILSRGDIRD